MIRTHLGLLILAQVLGSATPDKPRMDQVIPPLTMTKYSIMSGMNGVFYFRPYPGSYNLQSLNIEFTRAPKGDSFQTVIVISQDMSVKLLEGPFQSYITLGEPVGTFNYTVSNQDDGLEITWTAIYEYNGATLAEKSTAPLKLAVSPPPDISALSSVQFSVGSPVTLYCNVTADVETRPVWINIGNARPVTFAGKKVGNRTMVQSMVTLNNLMEGNHSMIVTCALNNMPFKRDIFLWWKGFITTPQPGARTGSSKAGLIAGVVVGSLVFILLVVVVIIVVLRRRKASPSAEKALIVPKAKKEKKADSPAEPKLVLKTAAPVQSAPVDTSGIAGPVTVVPPRTKKPEKAAANYQRDDEDEMPNAIPDDYSDQTYL